MMADPFDLPDETTLTVRLVRSHEGVAGNTCIACRNTVSECDWDVIVPGDGITFTMGLHEACRFAIERRTEKRLSWQRALDTIEEESVETEVESDPSPWVAQWVAQGAPIIQTWSNEKLYQRHGVLTSAGVVAVLNAADLQELKEVRAELDRRDLVRMKPKIDQLEVRLDQYKVTARNMFLEPMRYILEHSQGADWSVQGFGMLRLYLSKETRLHIWHSSGKVEGVSTIHDHPWDFTSYIVAGRLIDRVYTMAEMGIPSHHKQRIQCGMGGGVKANLLTERYDVRLELLAEHTYGPGESYSRQASDLHETIPEDGTITLVTRTFKSDTEHAWVCFPLGTEWGSAEPRKATAEEVERFVKAGLAALEAARR